MKTTMNDTPTPRTNAEHDQFPMGGFTLDFARQLESELAAVTEQRDRLAEALRMYSLGYTEDDLNQLATTDSQMGEITPDQAQREIKRRQALQSLNQPTP